MTIIEWVIYGILALLILIVLLFWLWFERSYQCRIRIKDLVQGRKIVKDYRGKPFTDKEGVMWWKLIGERNKKFRLIPLPPEECIELGRTGKKYIEAYRTEGGEVIFLKESGDVKPIPEDLVEKIPAHLEKIEDSSERKEAISNWKKKTIGKWMKDNNVIAPYQPITTKQRMIYVQNIKKAESRKPFTWQQHIIPIASLGALVLIIIAGMVFWGDLAKPAITVQNVRLEQQERDLEMLRILQQIQTNTQSIGEQNQEKTAGD